jgi:hypothetical protein
MNGLPGCWKVSLSNLCGESLDEFDMPPGALLSDHPSDGFEVVVDSGEAVAGEGSFPDDEETVSSVGSSHGGGWRNLDVGGAEVAAESGAGSAGALSDDGASPGRWTSSIFFRYRVPPC